MKTSNPYAPSMTVKSPPETINNDLSKASGKAKARYPDKPIGKVQNSSAAGGGGKRAFTPGTSPSGS